MNTQPQKPTPTRLDDAAIAARARGIFRTACENADSYHTLRLGLARRKALQASRSPVRLWAPLGGAAVACCVLAVGVLMLHPGNRAAPLPTAGALPVAAGPGSVIEEIPEVGSNQMEMVQDLDFYRWLATQPNVAAASGRNGH